MQLGDQFIWNYKSIESGPPEGCCLRCIPVTKECYLYYYNFPMVTDFTVSDPQDDLAESMTKMKTIVQNLDGAICKSRLHYELISPLDFVDWALML